jgi:hypothetical protein
MDRAMRQAQLSNVTIDAFDPTGVHLGRHATPNTTPRLSSGSSAAEAGAQYRILEDPATLRVESLRAMADATGGRAIVNDNDMHRQVPAVLAESASYYLLGVEPPPPGTDGRLHGIRVRVSRPGVEARTRAGYYDPTEEERTDRAALAAAGATSSIASPMPVAGFPLEVAAAPFATADGPPAIALTVGIWPSANEARPLPRTETVDLVAALFNPETGDAGTSHDLRLGLTWTRADARFGFYEVLSRLPTPPGRHELRVGVRTDDGRSGSVYTTVEVPDFDDDLSLSGLVLHAVPSPMAGAAESVSDLLPLPPTARRTFRSTDEVVAFVRIYQKPSAASPPTVTARVTNAGDEVVVTDVVHLQSEPAGSRLSADYEAALPLATLEQGEYLLTVAVVAGERTAQRQLRFRVE